MGAQYTPNTMVGMASATAVVLQDKRVENGLSVVGAVKYIARKMRA